MPIGQKLRSSGVKHALEKILSGFLTRTERGLPCSIGSIVFAGPRPMDALPEGYVRLWHIIGDRHAKPPIPPIIPVSKSTWYHGMKTGRFPKSVKISPKITAWKIEDIRKLKQQIDAQSEIR